MTSVKNNHTVKSMAMHMIENNLVTIEHIRRGLVSLMSKDSNGCALFDYAFKYGKIDLMVAISECPHNKFYPIDVNDSKSMLLVAIQNDFRETVFQVIKYFTFDWNNFTKDELDKVAKYCVGSIATLYFAYVDELVKKHFPLGNTLDDNIFVKYISEYASMNTQSIVDSIHNVYEVNKYGKSIYDLLPDNSNSKIFLEQNYGFGKKRQEICIENLNKEINQLKSQINEYDNKLKTSENSLNECLNTNESIIQEHGKLVMQCGNQQKTIDDFSKRNMDMEYTILECKSKNSTLEVELSIEKSKLEEAIKINNKLQNQIDDTRTYNSLLIEENLKLKEFNEDQLKFNEEKDKLIKEYQNMIQNYDEIVDESNKTCDELDKMVTRIKNEKDAQSTLIEEKIRHQAVLIEENELLRDELKKIQIENHNNSLRVELYKQMIEEYSQ